MIRLVYDVGFEANSALLDKDFVSSISAEVKF